jgi:hypothetical protein
MPLCTARTATTAATKYQYKRAIYIFVDLNMPSLLMSIPCPIPPMSIVAVCGGDSTGVEIRMMEDFLREMASGQS